MRCFIYRRSRSTRLGLPDALRDGIRLVVLVVIGEVWVVLTRRPRLQCIAQHPEAEDEVIPNAAVMALSTSAISLPLCPRASWSGVDF